MQEKTREKLNRVIEMRLQGKKLREIAIVEGCTYQSISMLLKREKPELLGKEFKRQLVEKRRKERMELRVCPVCLKAFRVHPSATTRTCGKECGTRIRVKHKDIYNQFNGKLRSNFTKDELRKYNTMRTKKYYETKKGNKSIRKSSKKYYFKSKEEGKSYAWAKLAQHISQGKIKKPTTCSRCKKEDIRVCGYHPDYSRPLEVIWVCYPCSYQLRKINKKLSTD